LTPQICRRFCNCVETYCHSDTFKAVKEGSMRAAGVLTLLFSLSLTAAWADDKKNDPDQIGNRDVGKGLNCYSLEKEIAMGKQLAEEVKRQAKLMDDPIIGEYVNRIGQNLARHSDAKVPFTFQLIDDQSLNAFA